VMSRKILITIQGNDVAPRFDLCTEVLLATVVEGVPIEDKKIVVLPRASAEDLCQIILAEGVQVVVCGGIEEEYYQFLAWKKLEVMDSVVGSWKTALGRLTKGKLTAGAILTARKR